MSQFKAEQKLQLGRMLKEARERYMPTISQSRIADLLHVSPDTIERLESGRGKERPNIELLMGYCQRIARFDRGLAERIVKIAYPEFSLNFEKGSHAIKDSSLVVDSRERLNDPSASANPAPLAPGRYHFQNSMTFRRAETKSDAQTLYQTLRAAVGQDLLGENDITPVEVFDRWIATGKAHFCIAELFDKESNEIVSRGFYSIHPLTVAAYEAMKMRKLHHDDITDGDLVDGVFGGDASKARGQRTVLFVLDVEVIEWETKKMPAAYLTIDLLDQLKLATERTKVEAVAVLAATDEGKKWSDKFRVGGKKTEYFGLRHNNWWIHEMSGRQLKKAFEEASEVGWRAIPNKQYPFDSSLLRPSVTILEQLVGRWSER